jgi:hypothetical protein
MARAERLSWHFQILMGLLFAISALPASSSADDLSRINGIYRGTIGQEQVVLEMGARPAGKEAGNTGDSQDPKVYPIEGRYFYRQHGVDIHLVGMSLGDESIRLREYRRVPDDEFTAEWRLNVQGDRAAGTFCKCDLGEPSRPAGSLLKVSLRRISHEFHSESEMAEPGLYEQLLLDFPLASGPEIKVNEEIGYEMQSDSRFKVSRPRLMRFPDSAVMTRINREMAGELKEDRLHAAANLSEAQFGAALGGFYDEKVTVTFLPPYILSILVYRSWFWGGAHPNIDYYVDNYDLRAGKRFDLNSAFKTAGGGTAEEQLAEVLAKLYMRHYVNPPPLSAPEDCSQVLRRIISDHQTLVEWFSPQKVTLFLAQDGLVVFPASPYAYIGCSSDNPIPYNELTPFVRKNTPFYLLLNMNSARH